MRVVWPATAQLVPNSQKSVLWGEGVCVSGNSSRFGFHTTCLPTNDTLPAIWATLGEGHATQPVLVGLATVVAAVHAVGHGAVKP